MSDKPIREQSALELLETHAKAQQAEIERLEALVYVPGLWRCAKCAFQLIQANLNARDGSVSSRDEPGDKCPNCGCALWRVTERDAGNDLARRCEGAIIEEQRLREALEYRHQGIERLRAALQQISDGPPQTMENSSVAAWAAWIAGHALVGRSPDETTCDHDYVWREAFRYECDKCGEISRDGVAEETTPKYGTCAVCGGVGGAHFTYCKDSPLKAAARQRQD